MRTATSEKSMRVTWEDGASVDFYFVARGSAKSAVRIQHRKLESKEKIAVHKEYWTERLKALGEMLCSKDVVRSL